MVYDFAVNPAKTPQAEAIPGREADMGKMASGGFGFKIEPRAFVRRCLLLGTVDGTYYADKRKLSQDFISALKAAIADDPEMVAKEILYASEGHAINNHAPILALVLLSMGDRAAKVEFKKIFSAVVRTGSHFHEWMSYTKSMRGMGRLVKEAGLAWLQREDARWLSYQMTKYGSRYNFSFRDELRLFKPRASSTEQAGHDILYGYVTGKDTHWQALKDTDLKIIYWIEWLKQHPEKGAIAVREGNLTHEMVTAFATMNREVWQALFEKMPCHALLRNLGSLTDIGVLRPDAIANLDFLEPRLIGAVADRKTYIHPIDVLKAGRTYASGGTVGRSSKRWTPVPRALDLLDELLMLSFETQEPTGRVFLHAVDISGSMFWTGNSQSGLTCADIATTMALATAKAEKNYMIRGFSTEFIDLKLTKSDSFRSALAKLSGVRMGATDASVAYQWAIDEKVSVDVFCFWTDGESWAGKEHPSQAFKRYREKVNPEAKAVYVTLTPNGHDLADPQDEQSFSFSGFDPSLPKAIQEIADL